MSMRAHRLVLTGASGGLGRSIALALAERCEAMILAGRDAAKLAQLGEELNRRCPMLKLDMVAGDLAEEPVRQHIVCAAQDLPGGIDLLINNAGASEFHEFESQSAAAIERQLSVNLLAPMLLIQALLPQLRRAPRAQVVNVGSIFGYLGYPGFAAYCASKFALRGFSQALRRELADTTVAVRYFAPRAIATPLNSPAVVAMNRELGNAEDSAQAVADSLLRFLEGTAWERKLGWAERLYVLLNQLFPSINDRAIRGQLQVIRRHLPVARLSANPSKGD